MRTDRRTDRETPEQTSSEPRPYQNNQSTDIRHYRHHAVDLTGAGHVSQQYHLDPAGSSEDYRHSGTSETVDPRFCFVVNFDDGFHHALL